MGKVVYLLKRHWLVLLLILIILYLLAGRNLGYNLQRQSYSTSYEYAPKVNAPAGLADMALGIGGGGSNYSPSYYPQESVDISATDRKIVEESYLSLKVKNVSESLISIKQQTQFLGGFMVNMYLNRPEESTNGNITIRVPTEKSDEMLAFLRQNSLKVVNENIQGRDVTDQYKDIDSRLRILESNLRKMEQLMAQTDDIDQILRIQNQIFSLQDQVDSYKGQLNYLEDVSNSVKITIYLSTDEYSLPYIPDTGWRPNVIFKEAVRSLVINLRGLGSSVIWLGVYSVIWLPALALLIFVKRKFLSK